MSEMTCRRSDHGRHVK